MFIQLVHVGLCTRANFFPLFLRSTRVLPFASTLLLPAYQVAGSSKQYSSTRPTQEFLDIQERQLTRS
jgi:hypothetical protein